jgi:aminoglycoside/choline kinase family phosphotransferase
MPARLAALQRWLGDACGLTGFQVAPASGDASFRRYFRITLADGSSLIAMDAPPDKEDSATFVTVSAAFRAAGLHVPAIVAQDLAQGFLLLEDLGSRHYLDVLDEANADRLYGDALSALLSLQACGPQQDLPAYDVDLLQREMALFPDWLLTRHLGLALGDDEQAMLTDTFRLLTESALAQPRVCVHRDYHSRNLLLPPAGQVPGVIDFQDAVIGPVTYDLVSLLKDCYIAWPRERVDHWAMGYFELAVQSGVLRAEHEDDFLRWFELMGVQRHLKAAGIFARLMHRDAKPGYLQDIPRTLGYIVAAAERYPELAGLARLIEQRVLPAL